MKRIISYPFTLCFIFSLALTASAQTKSKSPAKSKAKATAPVAEEKGALFFDRTFIPLGVIDDTETSVPVEFTFKNLSKAPVTISSVKVGCNCLAAEWPKQPLKFNEEAKIVIRYFPKGQSGEQQKEVTVYTDAYPAVYYLKMNVFVNDVHAKFAKKYPQEQGNLRFNNYQLRFNNLFPYSTDSFLVEMYNSTGRHMRIKEIKAPGHISAKASDLTIPPYSAATLKVIYYASIAKDYGDRFEEIVINTTDTLFPEKKIIVRSNVSEDFSGLTEKEKNNPPVFEALTPVVNLDTVVYKSVATATFVVTNKGKTPMYIRKAYGSCGCTSVSYDSSKPIKRNKKGIITVTFSTTYEMGEVSKKIFVITNTPQQTLHEMELKANVVLHK